MKTLPVSADGQAIALACSTLATSGDRSLKPLSPTDWSRLATTVAAAEMRPRDLIGLDAVTISKQLGIAAEPSDRLAALLSRGGQLALEVERLANLGIWMITRADETYPDLLSLRLGSTSPPVLFGAGLRSVFGLPAIAIVGSRDVDDEGLSFASLLGRRCAEQGFAVVSGGARGVDTAAIDGATTRGGPAIGVTADPLERLLKRGNLRQAIADELLTLVTPFHPSARWQASNAMRRNRLVYALSKAAAVVASSVEKGGTRAGALENLKADWVPLHVRDDGSAGNRALISAGGAPLARRIDDLTIESLTVTRQDSLLDGGSSSASTSTSTNGSLVNSPPESAFAAVWPLLEAQLKEPRSEKDVAELLDLHLGQARAWLKQAVDEGLATVAARPKRYSLVGPGAEQLHLNDA